MQECDKRGCRNLEWRCKDCGKAACTAQWPQNEWISVKDRLPEDDQFILMCDIAMGNLMPTVGWYERLNAEQKENPEERGFFTADHCFRMRLIVTHWTPLPEPPK